MKNIVIIGAGDLGKELVWLIEDINKVKPTYVILGFLDDDNTKHGSTFYGYKVLGSTELLKELNEKVRICAVIAIRDGEARRRIVEMHPEFDGWESIIHPTAVIASSSHIGRGCIFFPQVTVSVDTQMGNFGFYYIHAVVCNDCVIGDYVSVMIGGLVSEHVTIADNVTVEPNETIQPHTIKE